MKKFQKTASLVISLAVIATSVSLVFAATDDKSSPAPSASPSASASAEPDVETATDMPDFTLETGVVKNVVKDEDSAIVVLELAAEEEEESDASASPSASATASPKASATASPSASPSAEPEDDDAILTDPDVSIRLAVSEETVVLDNETGVAASVEDVKEGDTVYAYCPPIRGLSMPPYAPVNVLIVNAKEGDDVAFPVLVASAEKQTKGETVVISKDGADMVTITDETDVQPYLTKNIVKAEDVKEGDVILVWAETKTTSEPAKSVADKIVLIPAAEEEPSESPTASPAPTFVPGYVSQNVLVNGVKIDLKGHAVYASGAHTMVPLRVVAEALGFNVGWDSATRTALVGNDDVQAGFQIGNDKYVISDGESESFGVAPALVNETTFVPTEAICMIYHSDNAVSMTEDGAISIHAVTPENLNLAE